MEKFGIVIPMLKHFGLKHGTGKGLSGCPLTIEIASLQALIHTFVNLFNMIFKNFKIISLFGEINLWRIYPILSNVTP